MARAMYSTFGFVEYMATRLSCSLMFPEEEYEEDWLVVGGVEW